MKRQLTHIRREQIAEAALEIVQAHGLRGLSMERLAIRVGLVPSAIYRHFENKNQVLEAVLELLQQKLREILEASDDEGISPLERLHVLLKRHLTLVQHFPAFPRILFSDQVYIGSPQRKAQIYEIFSDYLAHVSRIVRIGQETGEIRSGLDPDTVAVMFLGLFQPAAMLWFASDGGFDVTRHIDRAWRLFRNAIAGRRR